MVVAREGLTMTKYLVRLLIASGIYIFGIATHIIPISAEDIIMGKIADVVLYEVMEHLRPAENQG